MMHYIEVALIVNSIVLLLAGPFSYVVAIGIDGAYS